MFVADFTAFVPADSPAICPTFYESYTFVDESQHTKLEGSPGKRSYNGVQV